MVEQDRHLRGGPPRNTGGVEMKTDRGKHRGPVCGDRDHRGGCRVVETANHNRDRPFTRRESEETGGVDEGTGAGGDHEDLAALSAGGGAQVEHRRLVTVDEHRGVRGDEAFEMAAGVGLGAGADAGEVFGPVDIQPDRVHDRVRQVPTGTELENDGTDQVLGADRVTGDREPAERFEVDEHVVTVGPADRDERRDRRRLFTGVPSGFGCPVARMSPDPPGPVRGPAGQRWVGDRW